jgi:DNA-binding CsgD family transcriptional regulator
MNPIASFHSARSFDSALDRLAEAVHDLGFDAVDYGFMPQARTADGRYHHPEIAWRNWPARWTAGWAQHSSEDPFLHAGYPRTLPLDWRDVTAAPGLSRAQQEALAYVERIGFPLDGMTVPIHLPEGAFAFVSAVSHTREGRWRARQAEVRDTLFVMAHDFHAAVAPRFGLKVAPRDISLTPREREVLSFAALGLSAPDSALRVHRSVETVRRQRKSAMDKLGAHTIAQAVAQALRLGLIVH